MSKQIVTCTGYGGTGSSAITDLLKEFESCLSLGEAEFWFLQDYNGISDLEYHLVEGNHRSKVSLAIERYRQYIQKNSKFYDKYFYSNFSHYSKEYLDSLIDTRFKKALSFAEEDNTIKRFFYFKLSPIAQVLFKKVTFQTTFEFSPWFPMVEKTYAYPSKNKFYRETKEYTSRLFNLLDKNEQYQYLVFDQLVPATNIERYFNYVDNMKVILVDRDPRDLYLLNQIHWKGASYICDTTDVSEYINWYKSLRVHQQYEDLNNDNILLINFESLIYEYDESIQLVCDFLNIDIKKHTAKKKYFNPEISIKNTKLWEREHPYKEEIKKIEEELSEFCYDK